MCVGGGGGGLSGTFNNLISSFTILRKGLVTSLRNCTPVVTHCIFIGRPVFHELGVHVVPFNKYLSSSN